MIYMKIIFDKLNNIIYLLSKIYNFILIILIKKFIMIINNIIFI
jgi:hypothetical protein